jgi:hypothetical protein
MLGVFPATIGAHNTDLFTFFYSTIGFFDLLKLQSTSTGQLNQLPPSTSPLFVSGPSPLQIATACQLGAYNTSSEVFERSATRR